VAAPQTVDQSTSSAGRCASTRPGVADGSQASTWRSLAAGRGPRPRGPGLVRYSSTCRSASPSSAGPGRCPRGGDGPWHPVCERPARRPCSIPSSQRRKWRGDRRAGNRRPGRGDRAGRVTGLAPARRPVLGLCRWVEHRRLRPVAAHGRSPTPPARRRHPIRGAPGIEGPRPVAGCLRARGTGDRSIGLVARPRTPCCGDARRRAGGRRGPPARRRAGSRVGRQRPVAHERRSRRPSRALRCPSPGSPGTSPHAAARCRRS
jgi:hypothetical protein